VRSRDTIRRGPCVNHLYYPDWYPNFTAKELTGSTRQDVLPVPARARTNALPLPVRIHFPRIANLRVQAVSAHSHRRGSAAAISRVTVSLIHRGLSG
jgi:hypothetical protein